MRMKRYIIGIFIVLVCVDIALGVWAFHNRNAFASMSASERMDAMRSANLSAIECRYIMPENSRNICFQALAEQDKNIAFCSKITDQSLKKSCEFDVYARTGILLQKIIPIAATGDTALASSLCPKLSLPEQEICDGYIAMVSDPTANDTLGIIGRLSNTFAENPDLMCSAILRSDYRDNCFSATGECDKVRNTTIKDNCFFSLASKNSSLCARIAENSVRDSCYESFVNRGDYSVCDGFSDATLKEQCEIMNKTLSDYSIRVNYLHYGGEEEAIERIATDSPEMAEKICDVVLRDDNCYYALSLGTGDVSYCQRIGSQPGIDLCLTGMAERMNDTGICDMVSDGRRSNCLADVMS